MPSPFLWVEPIAAAVVCAYFAIHRRRLRELLPTYVVLAVAAWIAEDTAIRAYGFYAYDPRWSLFVDQAPLAIPLIWPLVILSARTLVRAFVPTAGRPTLAIATGLLVIYDAALMEAVATRTGLWTWTEPGLFGVPPMGIVGWGVFAASAVYGLERSRGLVPLTAPLATHVGLLTLWWGGLRWVSGPIADGTAAVASVVAGLALSVAVARLPAEAVTRVPLRELWSRVPAALYFAVLLVAYNADDPALLVYTAAFAPPYLVLFARRVRRSATHSSDFERSSRVESGVP